MAITVKLVLAVSFFAIALGFTAIINLFLYKEQKRGW